VSYFRRHHGKLNEACFHTNQTCSGNFRTLISRNPQFTISAHSLTTLPHIAPFQPSKSPSLTTLPPNRPILTPLPPPKPPHKQHNDNQTPGLRNHSLQSIPQPLGENMPGLPSASTSECAPEHEDLCEDAAEGERGGELFGGCVS